jgi:hypothetical protein
VARPLKQIDPEQVLKLASIGCPAEEIAAELDVGISTIKRRFEPVIKKGHEKSRRMVRSMLFKQAAQGNTAAIIFLSKAWVGMKETPDIAINVSATAVGNQILFDEQTKKQLEDFHVQLQQRVFKRTHSKELVPSGNGSDQAALN